MPKTALIDQYYLIKALFMILLYIFFFATVGLSLYFWLHSGQASTDTDIMAAFVELDDEEAMELVLTWYLAIFVWGWLVFNNVRVWLISFFAPNVAHDEF